MIVLLAAGLIVKALKIWKDMPHKYLFILFVYKNKLLKSLIFVFATEPGIPGDITFNLIDKWRITVSWLPSEGLVDSYIINIRSDHSHIDESREVSILNCCS